MSASLQQSDQPQGESNSAANLASPGELARLCVQTGLLLMQHGAESALVESVTRRLGVKLGAESVEVAIMANAITVTVLSRGRSKTTVRRNEDRGINMHMVTEVQRAMLSVEAGEMNLDEYRNRIEELRPLRYPRWLLSSMIGVSCASFAALAGGDIPTCGLVLCASMIGMYVRLQLASFHFNPIVNFFVAAFVTTSIAIQGVIHPLGADPRIAMASCVLLFVPGFPMINSVSDMVKGYVNTGLSRGMVATLLAAATCAGIMLSMQIWNVWGWL